MNNLGPLIVNIDGLSLSNTDKLLLVDDLIGGVILFGNNYQSTSQLKNLLNEIDSMEKRSIASHVYSEFEDQYQKFGLLSLSLMTIGMMIGSQRKKS